MRKSMSYRNFNVAVYCPVGDVNRITDFAKFMEKFRLLTDHVKIGRVYLECYRSEEWCTKEHLLEVKDYFESRGIATSGGITTCADSSKEGFASLCYSTPKDEETLRRAVTLNAEVFDEFIFDDFYFLNCRCPACIEKKGNRTWSEFRLAEKKRITENIVIKTAKEINPAVNVIVKYPQWYDSFNEEGYDLEMEPAMVDSIYTGTETRNPKYTQQHIPKYLSYFIMRYFENAAPDRNLGGWFDPYECTYNLTSYLEQGYLTLFGKAKEVTLFSLGSLLNDPAYRTFCAALEQMFADADELLDKIGNPIGTAAYRPANARGENNIHNYLGMCGIPFEPCLRYPEQAEVLFLSEGAADDKEIVKKMQKSLLNGAQVIMTSGFVRRLGSAFGEFVNVTYSARKALVSRYADSKDNGINICGCYSGDAPVLIPQMEYCTNDVWELAAGYGTESAFPIVLQCSYGRGKISILTIPDDMGDLYHYPEEVLNVIRRTVCHGLPAVLEGPAGIQMFVYDNNRIILRSDLDYTCEVTLRLSDGLRTVRESGSGRELAVTDHKVTIVLRSAVNVVLELLF